MKRNITFIFKLFISTLFIMVLQKPLFFLRYHSIAFNYSLHDFINVIWHGLSLDATVTGYIVALPLLSIIASIWLPSRIWTMVIKWVLRLCALTTSVIFTVNMGLYKYWAFPLDASILQYLSSPKEAMASVTSTEIIIYLLIATIYFIFVNYIYSILLRTVTTDIHDKKNIYNRISASTILIFIGCCVFWAIRGGGNVVTANISKVYFCNNMFLNHASVNPIFSFLASATYGGDTTSEYSFFDETTREKTFNYIHESTTPNLTDTLLYSTRPNIILILAESFGRSTLDANEDGKPVAPEFNRIKSDGIFFDNMFANSYRTDRGTVAVLSGFPSQTRSSIMKNPAKSRHLASIARSLHREGYATSFVYGGDPDFTNTSSYLYGTGFDIIIGQNDVHVDAPTSKWGYADDVMSKEFIEHVRRCNISGKRFFTVWQTLSSHEPFDVPMHRLKDKMLNSMAFADSCICTTIDILRQSPEWNNTLVIVIADHAYPYPYGISSSAVLRHRIPMLWIGGTIRRAFKVETFASQMDLAATLLSQMGIPHDDFPFSRDIFGAQRPKFGYWVFNNGFGIIDAYNSTIYDCTSNRVISSDSTYQHICIGKTLLQTTYETIERL